MNATQELPGSEGKLAVLSARLDAYEDQELSLHHPDDDRTPRQPPHFEFDSQYRDIEPVVMSPQQRLAAGMIREAVDSIYQFRKTKDEVGNTPGKAYELRMLRLDAIQSVNWMFSDDSPKNTRRLTFADVCEFFGADPDAMRMRIAERLGGNPEEGELV